MSRKPPLPPTDSTDEQIDPLIPPPPTKTPPQPASPAQNPEPASSPSSCRDEGEGSEEDFDDEDPLDGGVLARVGAVTKGGGRVVVARNAIMLVRAVGNTMVFDFGNGHRASVEFETEAEANGFADQLATEFYDHAPDDPDPSGPPKAN